MSTENTESNSPDTTRSERRTCRVKWFGKGYGFITDVHDPSREYFVHHSAIVVSEPTEENQYRIYKRLEKGEYIQCSVIKDSENRDCAVDVTGIERGPLMCESNPSTTRNQPRRHRYSSRSRSRSRSRKRYHRRHTSYDDSSSSDSHSR